MISKIIIYAIIIGAVYSLSQYARTKHFIRVGEELAVAAAPVAFQQMPEQPTHRILNIGDSSVVGTGSSDPALSVAGRFGADYPDAHIVNLGINGTKTGELIERFEGIRDQQFDLIVIHTGGNDIVRFTPYTDLEQQLPRVLDLANAISDTVVLLHGGNVGTATLFPAGTRWLFTNGFV
jgi:lysophospholipase L1-like esterase